jgi:hypothetical protein
MLRVATNCFFFRLGEPRLYGENGNRQQILVLLLLIYDALLDANRLGYQHFLSI